MEKDDGSLHAQKQDDRSAHLQVLASKSHTKLQAERRKEDKREKWPWLRKFLLRLVHNPKFEAGCGLIILFNMVLVVLETDSGVDEGAPPGYVEVLTNCLLGIYTAELTMKMYVFRLEFFHEMWNVLDFFIVGVDLIFILIALVVDKLPSLSILRVFRLVRLARAFKAARAFRELNSLLRACTCAMKAIFWGMVMMCMTLTVWGILAVQLIHPINKRIAETKPWLYQDCDRCPRAFSTVFDSVLTFWKQLVAGDSWGTLCEPIVEEDKRAFAFFMLVLVTVNLTMLNCILAVVVEAGAAAAAADQRDQAMLQEKAVMRAEDMLIDICQGLDSDASGTINIEEFLEGYHGNKQFRECLDLMHVTEADMFMIFNICDEDDSGDVDYREFVDQLRRIKHSGEQMLLHYVTDIRHLVNKIRPEIFKPAAKKDNSQIKIEEKHDQARSAALQQKKAKPPSSVAVTVPSNSDVQPNFSAGILQDAIPPLAEGNSQKELKSLLYSLETSTSDTMDKDRLEHIFQINEDLVAIMGDVAKQSKVQTGLLNMLVDGCQGGQAGSNSEAPGTTAAVPDDPNDGAAKGGRAQGRLFNILVDGFQGRGPSNTEAGTVVPDEPSGDAARSGQTQKADGSVPEFVELTSSRRPTQPIPQLAGMPGCCVRMV